MAHAPLSADPRPASANWFTELIARLAIVAPFRGSRAGLPLADHPLPSGAAGDGLCFSGARVSAAPDARCSAPAGILGSSNSRALVRIPTQAWTRRAGPCTWQPQ